MLDILGFLMYTYKLPPRNIISISILSIILHVTVYNNHTLINV